MKATTLTVEEKTSARAIRRAWRPKLDPDAWQQAISASIDTHGEGRHAVVKWHALHARAQQLD